MGIRNPFPRPAIPAGTWPASHPGHVLRPATVPQSFYNNPVTVDIGIYGVSPNIVFNASGDGQAQVGPAGVGETWQAAQASLSTNLGQLGSTSTCALYVGPLAIAAYQVAANLTGGGTQYALGGINMAVGDYVWAVWTGGAAGEVGQLKVSGSRTAITQ
jgi:hypothetical protein